ncbi:MAG: hypothetical protein LC115_07295 [Bacteroidia bacterium]|nr:hypothetical protein [Bacteroidia bacterium]
MNYIVYQAYGKTEILHECLYSLSTLWPYILNSDLKVIVYTDQPDWFRQQIGEESSVLFFPITAEKIQQWRGKIDFVHRVKIAVLLDISERVSGNLLYVDTDTTFMASPELLFDTIESQKRIMHTQEDILEKSKLLLNKKIYNHIRGKTFNVPSGQLHIKGNLGMWNAGVLGFQTADKKLLIRVLDITDLLYKEYPKHTIEQLAFSVVFQENGYIFPAENILFHYWNFKEFREVLAVFWQKNEEKTWEQKCSLAQNIRPEKLIQHKISFEQKPYWIRKLRKWFGIKLKLPISQ